MTKEQRIKALEKRVAELEREALDIKVLPIELHFVCNHDPLDTMRRARDFESRLLDLLERSSSGKPPDAA